MLKVNELLIDLASVEEAIIRATVLVGVLAVCAIILIHHWRQIRENLRPPRTDDERDRAAKPNKKRTPKPLPKSRSKPRPRTRSNGNGRGKSRRGK